MKIYSQPWGSINIVNFADRKRVESQAHFRKYRWDSKGILKESTNSKLYQMINRSIQIKQTVSIVTIPAIMDSELCNQYQGRFITTDQIKDTELGCLLLGRH